MMSGKAESIPRTTPATLSSLAFHVTSLFVLLNAFQTLKEPCSFDDAASRSSNAYTALKPPFLTTSNHSTVDGISSLLSLGAMEP